MLRSFNSSVKNIFSAFCEVLFPPLCVICKERSKTKLFCPPCWELCAFPDPAERCPHCSIQSDGLCRQCVKKPIFSFTHAFIFEETAPAFYLTRLESETIASFAIYAFIQLEWPVPDIIIPMPDCKEIALKFSEMLEKPLARTDPETIEEDKILLIMNRNSSVEQLRKVLGELSVTSPKRGFILSLFQPKSMENSRYY
jgi:hypothetical protein